MGNEVKHTVNNITERRPCISEYEPNNGTIKKARKAPNASHTPLTREVYTYTTQHTMKYNTKE